MVVSPFLNINAIKEQAIYLQSKMIVFSADFLTKNLIMPAKIINYIISQRQSKS